MAPSSVRTVPNPALAGSARPVIFLAMAIVFLIYSRGLELFSMLTGVKLPYVFTALLALMILCAVVSGRLRETLRRNQAVFWLIAFTGWMVMSTPFSFWRTASAKMLATQWMPVLMVVIAAATLLYRLTELRRLAGLLGAASAVIALASFRMANYDNDNRLRLGSGSLGNSNDMAMLVLFGLPFLLRPLLQRGGGWAGKAFALLAVPASLVAMLRTGSRGALLTLVIMSVILLLLSRGSERIKLVLLTGLGVLAVGLAVNERVISRLKTLVHRNESIGEATLSEQHRIEKLKESLLMTIQNPLFGVGPGVHDSAQAALDEEAGLRADWQVSHNTLTQVSSETGIPGLVFYSFAIFGPLVRLWKVRRQAIRQRFDEDFIGLLSAYLLSSLALITASLFGSNAYLFFIPVLSALIDNLQRATAQVLVEQSANARGPVPAVARTPRVRPPARAIPPAAVGSRGGRPASA